MGPGCGRHRKVFTKRIAQHVGLGVCGHQVLVSFLRSLQVPSIYPCLLHLSMSGMNILPGAHDFVVSGTINAASIVRKIVRFSQRKLTTSISCRLTTSITNLATERHPMQQSPSYQTQALGSQVGRTSLQNLRIIFLLVPMMEFRRESTFYCMEWGVLERPKFA